MKSIDESIQDSITAIRELPQWYTLDQQVWVHIDVGYRFHLTVQDSSDSSVSREVWEGVAQIIRLPDGVIPAAVARWLADADVLPLLRRVMDGMDEAWVGGEHVGSLTADAEEALSQLNEASSAAFSPSDLVELHEASDWLSDVQAEFGALGHPEAAEQLAVAYVNDGLPQTDDEGLWVVVDVDDTRSYAREVWEAAHADSARHRVD